MHIIKWLKDGINACLSLENHYEKNYQSEKLFEITITKLIYEFILQKISNGEIIL